VITLGIETATTAVGVALGGDDGVLALVEINEGRRHAEVVAPAIEFACRHARVGVGDIAAIGVDIGPGLFTGMRVGIATAKVMAQALGVPVVGVCSLDLLAAATPADERLLASVIDARKAEVFFALYTYADGRWRRVSEPAVGTVEDLNAAVVGRGRPTLAVGDGAWRWRDQLEGAAEIAPLAHPSAATLVGIARRQVLRRDADAATGFGEGPADVSPMYLRQPDAEINWARR
jgi:tRNA threonylcarbamoyladenosine biosynthesis protein TsaB